MPLRDGVYQNQSADFTDYDEGNDDDFYLVGSSHATRHRSAGQKPDREGGPVSQGALLTRGLLTPNSYTFGV